MQKREPTQEEIEEIINSQKERYNEQLEKLYRIVAEYRRLSGIDPITGRKSISFEMVSENENAFLEKASRDGSLYPIVRFEDELLKCMDRYSGEIRDISGARRFCTLLKTTSVIGHRFLLMECINRIRSKEVWNYLYANNIVDILLCYLKENNDIVTDYEFLFSLLSLLNRIPTPSILQLPSSSSLRQTIENALSSFRSCGDPDLEDLASEIIQRF